ncbi:MAG TPA: hypothetical protein VNW06_12105 [Cytophagaceae bacterium]|jgi:hypothetical protein|nr:hypothetical protein [Cytophagaceae bacterium]
MFIYLKEQSYYEDRYDLCTIENCLRIIDFWGEKEKENGIEGVENAEMVRCIKIGMSLQLYCAKGESYRDRESSIKRWMNEDREKDEFYAKVQEPQGIRCRNCQVPMSVLHKDHWYEFEKPLRVIFLFECPKCRKRKGIFDNGQEFESTPDYCPKCKKEIKVSFRYEGKLSIWERNCPSCGFTEKDIEDQQKKKAQQKAQELKDKRLFEKYRAEFCLSPSEGMEYILQYQRLESFTETLKREEEKKADPDYPKVEKLKRLEIVELEKLLSIELEKQKYIKLTLEKPDINKFVIVPFTVQDADSARKERDSEYKLRKLFKKMLIGTNWRLMSEGVSYRLGYLSGRLKGHEREEDLLEVVKSDK